MQQDAARGHPTRARRMSLSSLSASPVQGHSVLDTASKGREVIQRGKAGHRDNTPGRGDWSRQGRSRRGRHRWPINGGWRSGWSKGRGGSYALGLSDSIGVECGITPAPKSIYNFTYSFRNTKTKNIVTSLTQVQKVLDIKCFVEVAVYTWRKSSVRGQVEKPL